MMPLSETYPSITEHLRGLNLLNYSISISSVYSDDVYLATDSDKPVGRIITFGNSVQQIKIDLYNKIATVKPIIGDVITYQMSNVDVVAVQNMIASSMLYNPTAKVACDCICHRPGLTVLHAFPCCNGGYK